ncbi:TM2 domain-containing protein [Spirulina subsalsa]|uniref:TM2 domain-containing protein n=1 Tax=Spirulina subsalsa TaxID=54311 RepID=UPI00037F4F75|nr:NINE protein [Spirulina subsalsa]
MRGTVLSFSIQSNQGFISGDDGKRYNFLGSDWNLSNTPTQGVRVDFDVDGNHAISIYEDPNAAVATQTTKSRTTTGILALLLGGLGIHFFYLGTWGWGLVSVLFCWTYIPAIAGLILGIRYLSMTDQAFERKIKKMQGAFGIIEL